MSQHQLRALLYLARLGGQEQILENLHHAIERQIRSCEKNLHEVKQGGNEEAFDAIADRYSEQVEELLGMSFVAAQVFITAVRTKWKDIQAIGDRYGIKLGFSTNDLDLIRDAPKWDAAPFSVIEAINAVANYWKHNDEWPTKFVNTSHEWRAQIWEVDKKSRAKPTIEIVTALGMTCGSTGKVRTAVSALGVTKLYDLSSIREALTEWADRIFDKRSAAIRAACV